MNGGKMSKFNISIVWVFFCLAFVDSLMEDYYYRDIIDDGIKLEFFVSEMTSDRLIKIYYKDKLIITQQDTSPANMFFDVKKLTNLQIIVPDNVTLMLDPGEINSDEKVIVYHSDGKIHVYQKEEINSTILVPEFNKILNSEETLSVLSNEFNQNKLVSIFFLNNKLIVTQMKTPEETNSNLLPIKKLQTVISDKNKLLLHPVRFSSEIEINIIHKNGQIIVWTGEYDQIPNDSIDTPEIIEIITQNPIEFDTSFDSGETAEIFPQEFNLKKLVWIFFHNNQLNVTQLGAPEETRNNINYKHNNLTIITSDVNKLLIYPARITPEDIIRVRHENRTIYVWQGSDQIPKRHINRPDIFKIIKPVSKSEKPAAVSDKLCNYSSNFDKELLMVLPKLNLKQFFTININNKNNTKVETYNTSHKKISNEVFDYNNSQIIKSGSNSFLFYPINIDLDFKINVNDNSKASEEPKINETNEIDMQFKPSILHQMIVSNYTMIVDPKVLILKKLVRVSYNNKMLEVTQNGTFEESYNDTVSYYDQKWIQVIKPDNVTLIIHLIFINPNSVIKFRHENGRIYIWQGSDQLPKLNIDMPNVVQVIEPNEDKDDDDDDELKTVVEDLNQSVSDKITVTLLSNMYNPDKLIVVKHENLQIHLHQIDRVDDDGNKNPGYEDLHLSIPDKSSATIDPRKIDPSKMIIINYIKKKMHINTAAY